MRADALPLNTVLGEKQQWVVPVYQRHYEWETTEDRQLPKFWDDLKDETLSRLEGQTPFPHYFGAIIFSQPQNQKYGTVTQRYLVDGQQRITTFQILLAALREIARRHKVSRLVDVIGTYLFNEKTASMQEPERERFKLWPSAYDRQLYQHLADKRIEDIRKLHASYFYKNGSLIKGQAPNLLRAYDFLLEEIGTFINDRQKEVGEGHEAVLDALLDAFLSGFQIVVIQLDPNDDAQEIFASLNGLGKPLSPFDLIRNDVFHRARKTGEDDEKLFDERWKLFEKPYWSEQVRQGRFKRARADHLIAHAVIAETGREVNVGKIATEYQRFAKERAFTKVADEIDLLIQHANTYKMLDEAAPGSLITRIANVLRIWDLSTFHPLILAVNQIEAENEEKVAIYQLLESYIIRRELCGLSTKNYNKVVIGIIKAIRKTETPYLAAQKHLLELPGEASKMPSDVEVADRIARREAYGNIPTPRLRFILEQLEYGSRTKFDETTLLTGNLTIEHILPRKWSTHWPLPNGTKAPCDSVYEAIQHNIEITEETKSLMHNRQSVINTLGNLTLLTTSLNPSIGNGEWAVKGKELSKSLLALNREIAAKPEWDEKQIELRAVLLTERINRIWHVSSL